MLPSLPLACYPETWIFLRFSLFPFLIPTPFRVFFLHVWFQQLILWRQTSNIFLQFWLLVSFLDMSTKTYFKIQTLSLSFYTNHPFDVHILPTLSHFSSHPDAESLIPFPLIRHSFAVSPAFILSFSFPLKHAGSIRCEINCTEYERTTQRLVYVRSVFSLSLVQFTLHTSIFFKVNLPRLWD